MTDLADAVALAAVALAEDRSFALAALQELIDEEASPVFDGTRWTFPVKSSTKGEER